MQAAAAAAADATTPLVEAAIQRALANEWRTELHIEAYDLENDPPIVTVTDARRIIECLQETSRLDTLDIRNIRIQDTAGNVAVLNVIRNGLLSCPSVTKVNLFRTQLGNNGLERLLPAFYNTSVTSLRLFQNNIQRQHGGEVLRHLLVGNDTLRELSLCQEPIGPEGVIELGKALADNKTRLQKLDLFGCSIDNQGLAHLVAAIEGTNNISLTVLILDSNRIEGAEGGRQITLLLQRFPSLKVLRLGYNRLGNLGASALAPGLAAASHLETLSLHTCRLRNDGVANLVPDGQVNRTLTNLDLRWNNIEGTMSGENVIALASRCTNLDSLDLDSLDVDGIILNPDQQRRLDLLLDRKRLCTEAAALGGSPFPVLFRAVEEAHRHEHGLGAIFLILQNDGDDHFCNANNRAIE